MALLLRVINKAKWDQQYNWLASSDLPADIITDLRTNNNELSVWSVDFDRCNLDVVLAAAAAGREHLDKLDYTLLDEAIPTKISIKCRQSPANTPNQAANSLHRDLAELTVRKVVDLAHHMMPLRRERITARQVKELLMDALQKETLDRAKMKPKLLEELGF